MDYEEKYINGRWQYRTSPNGNWHELSVSALTEKASELKRLRDDIIDALEDDLSERCLREALCKALCL